MTTAGKRKPYDLNCWIELVEKGQWFMVWPENWTALFTWRPEMILRWPRERLDAACWHAALLKRPELAEYCDFASLQYLDEGYDPFWSGILAVIPGLSEHCDWKRLEETSRIRILCRHPELIRTVPDECVTGRMWSTVLALDVRYAEICRWEALSDADWASVLERQPALFKYFAPNADTDWVSLVSANRGAALPRCPVETLSGTALRRLLELCPEVSPRAAFGTLSPFDWSQLLSSRPEFADKCDFRGFSGEEWAFLLANRPKFAGRCDWSLLDGGDWQRLLESRPAFAAHCDWEKLAPEDWVALLATRPEFGVHCRIWDKFTFRDWQGIVSCNGDHAWRCPERMRKGIDGRAWFWAAADAWHAAAENGQCQKDGGVYESRPL